MFIIILILCHVFYLQTLGLEEPDLYPFRLLETQWTQIALNWTLPYAYDKMSFLNFPLKISDLISHELRTSDI